MQPTASPRIDDAAVKLAETPRAVCASVNGHAQAIVIGTAIAVAASAKPS